MRRRFISKNGDDGGCERLGRVVEVKNSFYADVDDGWVRISRKERVDNRGLLRKDGAPGGEGVMICISYQ